MARKTKRTLELFDSEQRVIAALIWLKKKKVTGIPTGNQINEALEALGDEAMPQPTLSRALSRLEAKGLYTETWALDIERLGALAEVLA